MNATNSSIRRADFILVALMFFVWMGCRSPGSSAHSQKDVERLQARAERGDANAQYELGEAYTLGDGVPRNDLQAFRWIRLAAEQGHADAQYNLGLMLTQGRGAKKNLFEAYKWFLLSAARGEPNAAMRATSAARALSREQIVDAQHQAAAFVPRKGPAASTNAPPEAAPAPESPRKPASVPGSGERKLSPKGMQ